MRTLLRAAMADKTEAVRVAAEKAEADRVAALTASPVTNAFEGWVRSQLLALDISDEEDIRICSDFLVKNVRSKLLFAKISTAVFAARVEASGLDFALQLAVQHIHRGLTGGPDTSETASSPTAARKHGNTRCVVTSPVVECVVSSGGSVIASCDFTDGLSTVHRGLKVKLSKDCDSLKKQYELLRLLNASTSGHFIGVFDCLGPADISFAHQEALGPLGVAGCHGLVMVAGGADMNRRIGYVEFCTKLPRLLNITVLRCSDMNDGEQFLAVFAAIRAVAVLHSTSFLWQDVKKSFSWLDVKPANFVSLGTNFVAIDLEGVVKLDETVPTSSAVGLAMTTM